MTQSPPTQSLPTREHGGARDAGGWTRRRALIAGAWSAPVIAAAIALPRAAASATITVELLGAVDDALTAPFSAAGDTVPLVFQVSSGGPLPADGTAQLLNAAGVAEWDESVLLPNAGASASIDTDGTMILPIVALAAGTARVQVQVGPVIRMFVVTLEQA